jgi:glycosyltransferase involved in cell wall biosynthesis
VNRRVLFIGYYYPDANMGGVRMRRLVRLLPRYGWEPVVLTHARGPDSADRAMQGVRVEEAGTEKLARLCQPFGHRNGWAQKQGDQRGPVSVPIGWPNVVKRWLVIPDRQLPWLKPAIARGRELLRKEKFSAIFASLDPRTSLLVAARLSRESGVPCVLEYRDLWTGNPYAHVGQPTVLHRWIHENLERKALRQAARVSAVCRGIADHLMAAHEEDLKAPVEVNYNFFDAAEYPAERRTTGKDAPFIISYTGALYGQREPRAFFEGVRRFVDQSGVGPDHFRFRWAGGVSGIDDLEETMKRTGVRPYMDFLGQVPHGEALRLLTASASSLLIQAPHDTIHLPGKLFEAIGARIPLLALSEPCEVAEIINRCRAGIVCPHDPAAVAQAIGKFHHLHTSGSSWEFDEARLEEFSADKAVSRLAALLDRTAG